MAYEFFKIAHEKNVEWLFKPVSILLNTAIRLDPDNENLGGFHKAVKFVALALEEYDRYMNDMSVAEPFRRLGALFLANALGETVEDKEEVFVSIHNEIGMIAKIVIAANLRLLKKTYPGMYGIAEDVLIPLEEEIAKEERENKKQHNQKLKSKELSIQKDDDFNSMKSIESEQAVKVINSNNDVIAMFVCLVILSLFVAVAAIIWLGDTIYEQKLKSHYSLTGYDLLITSIDKFNNLKTNYFNKPISYDVPDKVKFDSIDTIAGKLEVKNVNAYDRRIYLNGKKISQDDGPSTIESYYKMKNYDVAVIQTAAIDRYGNRYKYFILLRKNAKPKIIDDLGSHDCTYSVKRNGDTIEIDLGFSEGKRKTGKLSDGKFTTSYQKPEPPLPLTRDYCKALYEDGLRACSEAKENGAATCEVELSTSFNVLPIIGIEHNPGFNKSKYSEICNEVCKTKKTLGGNEKYEFSKLVCGRTILTELGF